MKTIHYSIIVVLIFSTSLYLKPIQADDANGVKIENIHTIPSSIIVGQTFKISATLVNNSSKPIFVDHGDCEAPFSVTFDNHVLVNETHPICNLMILEQKLNPGENTTASSPNLDLVYRAIQNGTVNSTIIFPYQMWNQTIQSNSNEIISEPFSFMIYGKTRVPTLSPSGNQAIIDVALSIPSLQKWSNDWQFDSMAFMTAKNQPGNWQYAVVYLKASSSSSLIPCDSNNDWSAMVVIDRTTMKVIQATYPTMESHNCDYTTGGGPGTSGGTMPKIGAPLKQFKSGIAADNVKCEQGLQLVIRAEDGSPACVTSNTALALESHGWAISPKSTIMHVELDQSHYPPNNLDYYFVKGMIYTANGPVQNSTVSIFGNNIPLGNAMTDPTGCFQFDSWNNTEINQEMSNANNNHQESYTLKITSAYLGDETHDAVNDTKSAVVYFQLFPIPPPFYVSSTNPPVIQVKQGDSTSLKLSVTHLTGGPVGPMELTVQRLPCGITYAIPSNAASNNGTFNISIATQDYTRVGKYYLDVIQDTSHFENPNIIPDPYIGMINLEVLPK